MPQPAHGDRELRHACATLRLITGSNFIASECDSAPTRTEWSSMGRRRLSGRKGLQERGVDGGEDAVGHVHGGTRRHDIGARATQLPEAARMSTDQRQHVPRTWMPQAVEMLGVVGKQPDGHPVPDPIGTELLQPPGPDHPSSSLNSSDGMGGTRCGERGRVCNSDPARCTPGQSAGRWANDRVTRIKGQHDEQASWKGMMANRRTLSASVKCEAGGAAAITHHSSNYHHVIEANKLDRDPEAGYE